MSTVTYESADNIATITINRAERMNALNEELILALNAAWQRFAEAAAMSRAQLLRVRDSKDCAEGRQAFSEKRPPRFRGS